MVSTNSTLSVWHSLGWALPRPFTLDYFADWTGAQLQVIRPWLIAHSEMASDMRCTAPGGYKRNCRYQIKELAEDRFIGICEVDICAKKLFRREDVLQYRTHPGRLNTALAGILGHRPGAVDEAFRHVYSLGSIASGSNSASLLLLGGVDETRQLDALQGFWQQHFGETVVLFPTADRVTDALQRFLGRCGWHLFVLEEHIEVGARSLEWNQYGRDAWQSLLKAIELNIAGEGQASYKVHRATQSIVERIESKIEGLGTHLQTITVENETLKRQLSEQLKAIADQVDPEYFQMVLTQLACGSVRATAEALQMSKTTYDRHMRRFRARGGIYAVLGDLLQARNQHLGSRSLEAYHEHFGKHQVAAPFGAGDMDRLVTELVKELQETHPHAWAELLSEFFDTLQR